MKYFQNNFNIVNINLKESSMEKENLQVLFEDNHIIVVVKPQNIPTQEDSSKDPDMLTIVKDYIKEKYNKPGNVYVGLVHRLDRPTGGVMIFAKTSKAASRLSSELKDGSMQKTYLAVVDGVPTDKRRHLTHFLLKNPRTNIVQVAPELTTNAKKAELEYELLESKNNLSLLKVHLFTGRGHQIRVQLSTIGYPIFGDAKYGKNSGGQNLALWAYELKFVHPTTKKTLTFRVYPNEEKTPWKLFNLNKVK